MRRPAPPRHAIGSRWTHSKRKSKLPWRRRPINEKKLAKWGTRGAVLLTLVWVVGIIETPWLRWFVLASVVLGVVFALWLGRES